MYSSCFSFSSVLGIVGFIYVIFAILVGVRKDLTMALICIYLIANGVDYLLIYWPTIGAFFGRRGGQAFWPFCNRTVGLLTLEFNVFFIYSGYKIFVRYVNRKYFFPDWALSMAEKVLILRKSNLPLFFLLWITFLVSLFISQGSIRREKLHRNLNMESLVLTVPGDCLIMVGW